MIIVFVLQPLLVVACSDKDGDDPVTECAKVLCAADEYCLSITGGEPPDSGIPYEERLPECTTAPADCDGVPTCDCLPECTECTDDDGVYCSILAP